MCMQGSGGGTVPQKFMEEDPLTDYRPRVLVADDEAAIRTLLGHMLRRAGYEAVPVSDGQEAIERLGESRFDALLLDLMMPRVDGFGVVEYLIETCPEMIEKTIVMTAFPKAAARERLHHLCHIVSKPFDAEELIGFVRSCVRTVRP